MYMCQKCGNLQDDRNAYPIIGECVDSGHPARCVVVCSSCGRRHILGGVLDFDIDTGGQCIMSFSEKYNPQVHNELPRVAGILHFESTDINNGRYAVVGEHPNLGSGILGWYSCLGHAQIACKNIKTNKEFRGRIETKEEALSS